MRPSSPLSLWVAVAFSSLVAIAASAMPVRANELSFAQWLDGFKREAEEKGLSPATLDRTLARVQPIPRVLELDRRQPEVTLTFQQYIERVINDRRVETARRLLGEHRPLLARVSQRYGVQPRFIVALWGIETDFGRFTGDFSVFAALATLAYDGRRSNFFRGELMQALRIVEAGYATPEQMRGSWAGAMGQSQFMPSSFLKYAVDYEERGRRDIWTSLPDVFASIANYLKENGWQGDQTWGRAVKLPQGFDAALVGLTVARPLPEWHALGARRPDGGPLPARELPASLVLPGGPEGPAFLVYGNYRAIMRYNPSIFYATAVGQLADRIEGG
ncbi:MAG: lytic murein transglycosylase [Proteobacteria bacterium]|nr:lytic murein transglycosylase [Pseudomonadota bacterium]MBI3496085.1 lytic murein transglycosylase [Pseudomonadota bacterium]